MLKGKRVTVPSESILTFTLNQKFNGKEHNIGKFRLSVTTAKAPILLQSATPEQIIRLIDVPPSQRTPAQKTTLANYYRGIDPDLASLRRAQEARLGLLAAIRAWRRTKKVTKLLLSLRSE